ncbi:hypothetical protein V8C86DRAFT_2634404 [Haematococcus lacustris]
MTVDIAASAQGLSCRAMHASDGRCAIKAKQADKLPPIVRGHDIFNLVAIGILNLLNLSFLSGLLSGQPLVLASLAYFLVDMVYVGLFPRCIKSPMVILGHHLISVALVLIPHQYPQYAWCLAYCMLVEVNTWLLIAKRTIKYGAQLMEVLFYVTWVLTRNVWYPWLVWVFYQEWRAASAAAGTPWNPILITPLFQACLTALNFHWTWALLRKGRAHGKQL